MATKSIKIHIANNKIMVTPRCQDLCRASGDQAEWEVTPPDLQFEVKFNKQGSPFAKAQFNNTQKTSGSIKVPPSSNGDDQFFPYIVDVAGYGSVDPGIIIW